MLKTLVQTVLFSIFTLNVSFAQGSADRLTTQDFSPAADCQGQPHGLSGAVLDPANDFFPDIRAENEPEFTQAAALKEGFYDLFKPFLHENADQFFDKIQGSCLSKYDQDFRVSLYFSEQVNVYLKSVSEAQSMETYAAYLPSILRLRINKDGKFVTINFSGRGGDALRLRTKVPGLGDVMWIHSMTLNTETHWMMIDANTMGDRVQTVAWSQFTQAGAPIIAHLDVKRTLRRLFRPIRWFWY